MTSQAWPLPEGRHAVPGAQTESGPLRRAPRKLASLLGVVVVAIAVGAMPLGWLLSGGVHETWLPGYGRGPAAAPRVRVVLLDQTGLVRFITGATIESSAAPSGMTATLVIGWLGGCGDYRTNLTLARDGDGFVLRQRTDAIGCAFLVGYTRAVAIHLWTPVDAGTISLVTEGAVRRPGSEFRYNESGLADTET